MRSFIIFAIVVANSFFGQETIAQTKEYFNLQVTEVSGDQKKVDNYTFIGSQVLSHLNGMRGYCFQSTADSRPDRWSVGQFRINTSNANFEHLTIYWLDNRQNIKRIQDIHTDIKHGRLTSELRIVNGSEVKSLPKSVMTYRPSQLTGQSHINMRDFARRCQKADIDAAIKLARDFEF